MMALSSCSMNNRIHQIGNMVWYNHLLADLTYHSVRGTIDSEAGYEEVDGKKVAVYYVILDKPITVYVAGDCLEYDETETFRTVQALATELYNSKEEAIEKGNSK